MYRPYPNTDRALRQVQRHPEAPACPACHHPVAVHATEAGERVCTRGEGRISCRECAELWARMPAIAALADFGRILRSRPVRIPQLVGPVVTPRP
jgi:hypothetical protein